MPYKAAADGIGGFVELNYSNVESVTSDIAGESTEAKSGNFVQRYNLSLSRTIYPNLRLNAGGIFEKISSTFESGDTDTKSSVTNIRPFIDLLLNSPLYTAGAGYNRREEMLKSTGAPSLTTVNENYNAVLGWRPEGFPSLDMRLTRTNTFDKEHSLQDITRDLLLFNSRYAQIKGLALSYQASYNKSKDKLTAFETLQLTHNGRATYSSVFLNKKVSLYTSYNITRQETETLTAGAGAVDFQAFPFAGLSSIDDTPVEGTLDPNSALIDGNFIAGSGINIGVSPIGGDARPRNMGLDLAVETEINTIFVWVDRELPAQIAQSFSWGIYISSDNLNWSLRQTVFPAQFGPFENRFEINFTNVTTRYIKVVVRPLTQAAAILVPNFQNPDRIFVAELQAFIRRPAEEVKGKITRTSHVYNLNTRARLLDSPSLFYDFSYLYTSTEPPFASRYSFSNGLFLAHRLSRVFSGSARVAREDSKETIGERVAYVYSASITAVPLKTLNHSLVYSGRIQEIAGKFSDTNSVFLHNTAELYKGINTTISGGLSFATTETGEKRKSSILTFGTGIIPHPVLSLNINYSSTQTVTTDADREKTSTSSRGDVSIAYNPFSALYLFASMGMTNENAKTNINQNYSVNWSPFPDGDLQFNFMYTESYESGDDRKNRLISPSARWRISSRTFLDISYLVQKSEAVSQTADSRIFNANLRMSF